MEGYVSHVTDEGKVYINIQGPGLLELNNMSEELNQIYSKVSECTAGTTTPQRVSNISNDFCILSAEKLLMYCHALFSLQSDTTFCHCDFVGNTFTKEHEGPQFDPRYRQIQSGLDDHLKR